MNVTYIEIIFGSQSYEYQIEINDVKSITIYELFITISFKNSKDLIYYNCPCKVFDEK